MFGTASSSRCNPGPTLLALGTAASSLSIEICHPWSNIAAAPRTHLCPDTWPQRGRELSNRIGTLLGKMGLGKLSVAEYRANLNGLNMFFGAVLGFVLTGTEQLNSWQFALVLGVLTSVVVSILYISSSRHRVAYSIYAVFLALVVPSALDLVLQMALFQTRFSRHFSYGL